MRYGAIPVDLIESAVLVAECEEDKIAVVLIELDEGKQDIEEGGGLPSCTFPQFADLLIGEDDTAIGVLFSKDHDGTVDPDGELVNELTFDIIEWRVLIDG